MLKIYYSGHGYSGTKGFSKGDLVIRDKQAFTFDDIYYCIQPVLSVIEIDIRLDSCYSGEWKHNMANGRGKLIKYKNESYEGLWKNNIYSVFD